MVPYTTDQVNLCPHLAVFQIYIDDNWQKHHLLTLLRSQNTEGNGCQSQDNRTIFEDDIEEEIGEEEASGEEEDTNDWSSEHKVCKSPRFKFVFK